MLSQIVSSRTVKQSHGNNLLIVGTTNLSCSVPIDQSLAQHILCLCWGQNLHNQQTLPNPKHNTAKPRRFNSTKVSLHCQFFFGIWLFAEIMDMKIDSKWWYYCRRFRQLFTHSTFQTKSFGQKRLAKFFRRKPMNHDCRFCWVNFGVSLALWRIIRCLDRSFLTIRVFVTFYHFYCHISGS